MGNKSQQNIFLGSIDPDEVPTLIESIKCKNSSRYDGITSGLIKDINYEISYPVATFIISLLPTISHILEKKTHK